MNEDEIFERALNVAEGERAGFLDQACAGNAALRARLDALLEAHFGSRSPLDHGVMGREGAEEFSHEAKKPVAHQTTEAYVPDARVEAVIAGRYKLLQQIGEGGMGSVWMADQTEPVKRRVAVKLIRAERGQSKAILSRFEAERQAIALMDHPHIAKLLDAGTTEAGAPYFVMELVKGIPLNEYCDEQKLSIGDRLALFMQVCGAIQHAHQKGIIHRDLKPSNILIESHDGKPVPKVIDFGLAKATSGVQLSENTLFTAFGSIMGTPLYMAPEQANFNAVDIDTRADVYALGVILYELLTGTTPISRETIKKAALDQMLKLIREQEAPTPSSRLSTLECAPSVAANRRIEPAKLGRFIKGELDWIVLKALAKERDRRYETANGFAKDIERFLNHEPVSAGPPTAAYRIRKFVQRNRGQVIAASMLLFSLLAGVAGTTTAMYRAWEAEGKTSEALDQVTNEQGRTKEALGKVTVEQARTQEALKAEQKSREAEAKAREEADKARVLADANADLAQKRFYATQITLASHALAAEQPARVLDLLVSLEPAKGAKDYRTWEWYHLLHEVNAGLRASVLARSNVATYTPDGSLLFVHDWDCVRFLDPVTGQDRFPKQSAGVPKVSNVCCMASSPDSTTLATGTFRGIVRFWDARTGTAKAEFQYHQQVRHIAWKPDGSQVAITFDDPGKLPRLQFRHGKTFEVLYEIPSPMTLTAGNLLAFSPDGKWMTCICPDGLRLHDLTAGKPNLMEHSGLLSKGEVHVQCWSPDSRLIATAHYDHIRIWDVATRKMLRSLPSRGAMDFTPDSKRLVVGEPGRRETTCWDIATGALIVRRGHLAPVTSVQADPKGRGWTSVDQLRGVKIWSFSEIASQPSPGQMFQESGIHFADIEPFWGGFSPILEAGLAAAVPDRKSIPGKAYAAFPEQKVCVTLERGKGDTDYLHVVSTVTGKVIQTEEVYTGGQGEVRISSQARVPVFLTATQDWSFKNVPIRVWELKEGRLSKRCENHLGKSIIAATLLPDGETLIAGDLRCYDTRTGQSTREVKLGTRPFAWGHVPCMTCSQDGKLVAVGFSDNRCFVIDWPSGRLRKIFTGHVGGIKSLAFFPDGRTLVSSASDGTIVWDIDTGQQRMSLPAMGQLNISPDGTTLFGNENGRAVAYRSVRTPAVVPAEQPPSVDEAPPRTLTELHEQIRVLANTSRREEIAPSIQAMRSLLEQPTADPTTLAAYADFWVLAGEIPRAITDLRKALELQPWKTVYRRRLAVLQMANGDSEGLQKNIETLLHQVDTVESTDEKLSIYWVCGLKPLPAELASRALTSFQKQNRKGSEHQAAAVCQALLQLRAGRLDDAVQTIGSLDKLSNRNGILTRGYSVHVRSLIQHAAKAPNAAKESLGEWIAWHEESLSTTLADPLNWQELLEIHLLRTEAHAKVDPSWSLFHPQKLDPQTVRDRKLKLPPYPATPGLGYVRDFREVHGVDLATLQRWFDELPETFRPVTLTEELGSRGKRFNAIAIDDGRRLLHLAKLGLTVNKSKLDHDRMATLGWTMFNNPYYLVEAQPGEDGARFHHLWFKQNVRRTAVWGERKELDKHLTLLREKSLFPATLNFSGGTHTIWTESASKLKWEVLLDLSKEQLDAKLEDARKRGYTPALLARSFDRPHYLYGVVLVENPAKLPWEVDTEMTPIEYERKLAEMKAKGYRPHQIVSAIIAEQPTYSALWLGDYKKK